MIVMAINMIQTYVIIVVVVVILIGYKKINIIWMSDNFDMIWSSEDAMSK